MKKRQTHFMSTVKLGPKSQIVIPKEVREMFELKPGDSLLLMADVRRGIAIQKADFMSKIAEKIFKGQGPEVCPGEKQEHLDEFASQIRKTMNKEAENESD